MVCEIVVLDEYQVFWLLVIVDDVKLKKCWNVVVDGKKVGGVYVVLFGGQIIGFWVGYMVEGWQGVIIIDDLLKVEDVYSKMNCDKVNCKLLLIVKSWKVNLDMLIIVIMQWFVEEDLIGFIKFGKVLGDWMFIEILVLIIDEYVVVLLECVCDMVEMVDCDEDGCFSYWLYKELFDDLFVSEKVDWYVFSGQYM